MSKRTAVIIGAGPAGLTAAYELLMRTDVRPIVIEASEHLGGLARTVNYKGNRIDIGGHRFFSKSDRVMAWWLDMLPMQSGDPGVVGIAYQGQSRTLQVPAAGPDPSREDNVMLLRERTSRIYFLRKFFEYPIAFSARTLANLGPMRTLRIGLSYARSVALPIRPERNLEEFFINRFGRELYRTFFKSYTEKVWGVPCGDISAEWGAQRVKGLSVSRAIVHNLKKLVPKRTDISQKDTETSLIDRFLYPKFGPGQMWQEAARRVESMGGEILMRHTAAKLEWTGSRITYVTARDESSGQTKSFAADFVFSTMPVVELVRALGENTPAAVRDVSEGLVYRDFITAGLLVKKLRVRPSNADQELIPDNWIYIQEPDVKLGRLQIFNNWSPWMVKDPGTIWLGLEYFCDEGDDLWSMSDAEFAAFAARELAQIAIIDANDVLDSVVIRMPKTYPAYFGAYERFDVIREYLDPIENLFLIGRNGMHKYNNQDHSMLTAMIAVDNIAAGNTRKDNIWAVNTEEEYHEEK